MVSAKSYCTIPCTYHVKLWKSLKNTEMRCFRTYFSVFSVLFINYFLISAVWLKWKYKASADKATLYWQIRYLPIYTSFLKSSIGYLALFAFLKTGFLWLKKDPRIVLIVHPRLKDYIRSDFNHKKVQFNAIKI